VNGWIGKVLRVNLTDKTVGVEELDSKMARDYVGGRGLASKYLLDEVDPRVDPFSPENKFIFATGPATGTAAIGGNRYMAITKSPLTGAIACPNSGGYWGIELKYAGYDMIIFEGKSKEPVYLWIEDGKAEIRSASHIWGKGASETQRIVVGETTKETKVACIGPAGENLVKFASIMNDKGRAAGRSGAGAVMASKNLKAVAVRGRGKIPVADEKGLKTVTKNTWAKVPKPLPLSNGTGVYLEFIYEAAGLPTRNFQTGVFAPFKKLGPEAQKQYFVRSSPCFRCPIGCGRITRISTPSFKGEGAGPEYEGLFSLGTCCGIDNLAAVTEAFFKCNELGMDVISAGVTIACAMEMFEKGYLSEKDAGMKLNFGDAEAMVRFVEQTGRREHLGDILAEGSYRLAEKYGHPEFSISVKKQEFPGYDPRACQGFGLAYATANCGASHMRAEPALAELWGMPFKLDQFATKGKAQYVISQQDEVSVHESMGICMFLSGYRVGLEAMVAQLEAITGAGYNMGSFMKAGERIWNVERLFNLRAGFTTADDTLPKRMLEEPMPEGPAKGHVAKLGEMLPEYYQLRGWDSSGNIPAEKLKELGIS
jgi:aldehyde:ferredoxin oxidoreductase